MKQPLVRVVVSYWNDFETTDKCLKKISELTYTNFHTLVVDNGSMDDSAIKLKALFPWIEIIRSERNLGHAGAVNLAVEHRRTQNYTYILTLDNDAFLDSECLTRLVGEIERKKNVAIACPLILSLEKPGRIWYAGGYISVFGNACHLQMGRLRNSSMTAAVQTNYATSCVMLARRDVFEAVGGFDENPFNYSEDLDFSIRVKELGFKMLFVPSAFAFHGESINVKKVSGKRFRDYYTMRNRLHVIRKHGTFFQRAIGIPVTILWYFVLHSIAFTIKGELDRSTALFWGVTDFFRKRVGWRKL